MTKDQSFRFSTTQSNAPTDCSLRLRFEGIRYDRQLLLLLRLLQFELLRALPTFSDRGRSGGGSAGRHDGRGRDLTFFRFRRVGGESRRGGSCGLPPEVGKEVIHAGQRTLQREIPTKARKLKNKHQKKVHLLRLTSSALVNRTARRSSLVVVLQQQEMHGYVDSIAIPLRLPQSVVPAKSAAKGKGKEREVTNNPQYDVVKSWTAQERDQVERKVSMASLRSSHSPALRPATRRLTLYDSHSPLLHRRAHSLHSAHFRPVPSHFPDSAISHPRPSNGS